MKIKLLLTLTLIGMFTFVGCDVVDSVSVNDGLVDSTDSTLDSTIDSIDSTVDSTSLGLGSIVDFTTFLDTTNGRGSHAECMVKVDEFVYIALQRQRVEMGDPYPTYHPDQGTLILKVDSKTDKVVDTIACSFANVMDLEVRNNELYVVSFGGYNEPYWGKGGVEKIDLATNEVTTIIDGLLNGGSVNDIAFRDDNSFYFSAYVSWGTTPVYLYDMNSATIIDTVENITAAGGMFYDETAEVLVINETAFSANAVVSYDVNTDSYSSVNTSLNPASIALWGSSILVTEVAGDYMSGGYGVINAGSYREGVIVSSDTKGVVSGGMAFILERSLVDNLIKLNSSGDIEYQVSLGTGFNAHDILVVDESKAYVLSYNNHEIKIIDPATGKTL